jgi:hypothetical protein
MGVYFILGVEYQECAFGTSYHQAYRNEDTTTSGYLKNYGWDRWNHVEKGRTTDSWVQRVAGMVVGNGWDFYVSLDQIFPQPFASNLVRPAVDRPKKPSVCSPGWSSPAVYRVLGCLLESCRQNLDKLMASLQVWVGQWHCPASQFFLTARVISLEMSGL